MAYVLNRVNRSINRAAVEQLALGRSDSVLEIGFGGGAALETILSQTDGPVAGIEVSEPMIRHVQRRFRRQIDDGRLEVSHADVARIPYEDESFDRVLSVNTIYFWPDAAAAMGEVHRVLRSGGRVVFATQAKEEMEKHAWTEHGFRTFADATLEDLISAAGFGSVRVERRGTRVFSTGVKR